MNRPPSGIIRFDDRLSHRSNRFFPPIVRTEPGIIDSALSDPVAATVQAVQTMAFDRVMRISSDR